MIDAVFISDLHLNPEEPLITQRFERFIAWAINHTKSVYILGDFFHVWPGDDALDAWSEAIAEQLAQLAMAGVKTYFMPGNRDFLLSNHFAQRANVTLLTEPAFVQFGKTPVLLVHGDRYCTLDKGHQWLRRVTRNRIFSRIFLRLSLSCRKKLVYAVRHNSQNNRQKSEEQMDVVPMVMLNHMQQLNVTTVIHGHTHKPGLTLHQRHQQTYQQYILSDWDDNPKLLCYNEPLGFYFDLLMGDI